MRQWLSGESLALIGPAKRLCHSTVEILDKGQHFSLEIGDRGKSAALEQLAGENAEPNLNLVHPGSVFGRIVKDDAMGRVGEKSSAGLHRSENAGFTFDPQIDVQVGFLGHIANQRFRLMGVEIVHDEMPLADGGPRPDGALDMSGEVSLIARGASRNLPDLCHGQHRS